MTTYPNAIDNNITLPLVYDNITGVTAATVNRLRNTILSIESALGINPQGIFTSIGGVGARLDNVDVQLSSLSTSVADVIVMVNTTIANLDGEQINLGTPMSGFLTGITSLQSATKITEAINTFNNIMSYLAPDKPQSMQNLAIDAVTSILIVQGANIKVSDVTGHGSGYFKTGLPAGSGNYRITKTQSFTLTTHDTGDATSGFSDADKGIMVVLVNGVQVAIFNLATAFDETQRTALTGQGISYSANTGSATPPLKLIGSYSSPPVGVTGSTEIYSIGLFNGFPLWQKGAARIINTTLAPGYNTFQIKHLSVGTDRVSQVYELFYDNGAVNPSVGTPTLNIIPITYNYLSGIKFVLSGSLSVTVTVTNAFVNTYLQSPLTCAFTVGISAQPNIDLSDPTIAITTPNSTDALVMTTKTFSINVANRQTINESVIVTYTNIYGNTFQNSATGAAGNILLNTYTLASTAISDIFVDENYRLLPNINGATTTPAAYPNDYVTIPGTIIGQWSSSSALTNGNAQCYDAQLTYPIHNFTTGYAPAQGGGTNYSGYTGSQVYYRAMYSSSPHSQGTISIGGIVASDITSGSPNIQIELKLPGSSGWKNLALPFNSGLFNLASNWSTTLGQGCLVGAPATISGGTAFSWSMGTGTTATSGFMYIIRITLFNTTKAITFLSESFT